MSYNYQAEMPISISAEKIETGVASAMARMYGWMFLGMLVTAATSMLVFAIPALAQFIFGNQIVFMVVAFAPLGLVFFLRNRLYTMPASQALAWFFVYAAVTGLSISFILFVYATGTIATAFAITGGLFGLMSVAGFVTKRDLSKWGPILFFGIIGLVIASVANFFFKSDVVSWAVTYLTIPLFLGLIVFKTQRVKDQTIAALKHGDDEAVNRICVVGALGLYISFINIFLSILRILGRRR